MLEHLIGVEGVLGQNAPPIGLVLLSSAPIDDCHIVDLRRCLYPLMVSPRQSNIGLAQLPALRHVVGPFHQYPSPRISIWHGPSDIRQRPSLWANPHLFISESQHEAVDLFREYLGCRADIL